MAYSLSHIAQIVNANAQLQSDTIIENLFIDSRWLKTDEQALFFALAGERRDGHDYIAELYERGQRNFVVASSFNTKNFPKANFLVVPQVLKALQQIARYHREQFFIPVIGITGSNGKTIVKEWLFQLLQNDFSIIRSPKSFNSQIGVPLSVWNLSSHHGLAIFEAGISQEGEMEALAAIIQPNIGILTHIGDAHSEGFSDLMTKRKEKEKLFASSDLVIARDIDANHFSHTYPKLLTWGDTPEAILQIREIRIEKNSSFITVQTPKGEYKFSIPFTDEASVENAMSCFAFLYAKEYSATTIAERMALLQPVSMRLELKKGINHCSIINDSYSADLSSLEIALAFLQQQTKNKNKTVILSDLLQSAYSPEKLYREVGTLLSKYQMQKVIAIGEQISKHLVFTNNENEITIEYFPSTEAFLSSFRTSSFQDEVILVKGARSFSFEKIVQKLEQQAHQTVLEINLNAIAHNTKQFQSLLKPHVKMMAMVKAFAYGTGSAEMALTLQRQKIDYLGVAYADEGIDLRKAGVHLPIMVMNSNASDFASLVNYQLEPVIYSLELLEDYERYLSAESIDHFPIHIEIETGMHRLGFSIEEIQPLAEKLKGNRHFHIQSAFSHLVAGEDEREDSFTQQQLATYLSGVEILQQQTGQNFFRHISNSAGIIRHPHLQLDMVRLGIGLYGISPTKEILSLQPAATWKTTVAQIKTLKAGETVSYNRRGIAHQDTHIATIRVGYADGYPRRLGYGKGNVWIKGNLYPIIGTVCMDMLMVDISNASHIQVGDSVILFGKELPLQQVADWAETIPYEIMTGISQRVKRIYFEE